jgi:hypothetical protein
LGREGVLAWPPPPPHDRHCIPETMAGSAIANDIA